jgi:outer membrane protein assembly factor BamE
MQRKAYLLLLCLVVGGCSFSDFRFGVPGVYRIDIPQGNIVTQEMVDQLQPGMSKRQVRFVMGTPLVIDTLEPDRWDYVHSIEKRKEKRRQERLSLYFENDVLVRISGDFAPSGTPADSETEAAEQTP